MVDVYWSPNKTKLVLSAKRITLQAANYLNWKFLFFLGTIFHFTEQTVEFTVAQKHKI